MITTLVLLGQVLELRAAVRLETRSSAADWRRKLRGASVRMAEHDVPLDECMLAIDFECGPARKFRSMV